MKPDDILFSPISIAIPKWRKTCRECVQWIENNRAPSRMNLSLNRLHPPSALLLEDFAEAYHEKGQTRFWRLDYPKLPFEFEFDGVIESVGGVRTYPVYGEIGSSLFRSIEDANLVRNTYTLTYIYPSYSDCLDGQLFLQTHYP
jgi:hypothetical protein